MDKGDMKWAVEVDIAPKVYEYFKKKAMQKVGPSPQSLINEILAKVVELWQINDMLSEKE